MTATASTDDAVSAGRHRRQLMLKHVLLSVLFFGIACGCIRYASVSDFGFFTMPGIVFLALSFGTATRRYVISSIVVAILAFASYATTSVIWDGGFPFAELRITLVDESGTPLESVEMHVFNGKSGKPAHDYPIAEYGNAALVTNRDGQIVCHQTREGLQFGGHAWSLFWCIPMGAKGPEFDVRFEHASRGRLTVPIWELFDSHYTFYEQFPKSTFEMHGQSVEMPIYDRRIEMSQR